MPVPPVMRTVRRHDDLADVSRLAQVAERIGRPADIPRRDGQGRQNVRLEHRAQVEHVLVQPRPAGSEQVEGLIVHAGMAVGDNVGVTDVGLAHLQEDAAAGKQAQRGVDEFACQRVQYDVDAASVRHVEELLLEVECS
jgi:hypothetical protein